MLVISATLNNLLYLNIEVWLGNIIHVVLILLAWKCKFESHRDLFHGFREILKLGKVYNVRISAKSLGEVGASCYEDKE